MSLLVINGPNLNLLGTREPGIYGTLTLDQIKQQVELKAEQAGVECDFFQSNAEHEIVDKIQLAKTQGVEFIVINPAAFTHTSVAIRDALAAINIPFIEIHLSNPHSREPFRKHSYVSDLAVGIIAGFGADSYLMACDMAVKQLTQR
ncbi:MAG: type II 3-dehydroquinate dehydratase [Kangiellaceae bacterium]|nr:type II 3-dehydroquinate dehydratase [Kangiellaceae bacterium]MCW9001026.1 type II 3-dehydroquinate dehydratase [Kangiellaceae bacterium]